MGVADRACYDLKQHSLATGTRLVAEKRLPQPKTIDALAVVANKQSLGQKFKQDGKAIIKHLNECTEHEAQTMAEHFAKDGCVELQQLFVLISFMQLAAVFDYDRRPLVRHRHRRRDDQA